MDIQRKKKLDESNSKGNKKKIIVQDIDLSECGKYQEMNGSW